MAKIDNKSEQLYAMRHSLAHIMATAVQQKWPKAKFGVGPVIENGFYYDLDLGNVTLSEDDFPAIEQEMQQIIKQNQPFEKSEMPIDEAIDWAKENNQPYKLELLNDLQRSGTTVAKDLDSEELGVASEGGTKVEKVSFYSNGPFTDLCRGPHVASTSKVGAFKLMKVAGAYWRGKEDNPQMQRLYGVAFETKEELDKYLAMLEEAKGRDHRLLGEQLQIFTINEDVGKGLPLLMPRGSVVKSLLGRYMRQIEEAEGYSYVDTPVIAHERLYQSSGHAQFYSEDMFTIIDSEDQKFYVSPMNCPHHHKLYEKLVISYNDLPLKLAEQSGLYRHELSGTLTGLIRVRGPITQNDAHIYVTPGQLKDEFIKVLSMFKKVYEVFAIDDYWYRLSLPDFDKDKFEGDKQAWRAAGDIIRQALEEFGADFVEAEGEAAFYGPKVDIQTRNVLGKEDSIATSQIDLLVPTRMGLTYVDSDNNEHHPLVIHRAILGSIERFMGFYLEKTAGWLPFWLAPEQVRVLTINDSVKEYVDQIREALSGVILMQPLKYNEIRLTVDDRNESLGKKIRDAVDLKIPLLLIVGPRDQANQEVSVRTQVGEQKVKLDQLTEFITNLK
ncbi:threonine--tRNA ligase [Candidatus Saccharibacteria bacterium]|nr:threonine--tRNA ligase [Candidatus Saccharibacteria bacterium]